MPGDRFSLAVRVRCQINTVCLLDLFAQAGEKFALSADRNILRFVIVLDINSQF